MNCPWCNMVIKMGMSNAQSLEEITSKPIIPIVCEDCAGISLLIYGEIRKITDEELVELKKSPIWGEYLEPVINTITKYKSWGKKHPEGWFEV